MAGNKRASIITGDDVFGGATGILSVFIPDPEFQGQTKDKLSTTAAFRLVESAVRDRFEKVNIEPGRMENNPFRFKVLLIGRKVAVQFSQPRTI